MSGKSEPGVKASRPGSVHPADLPLKGTRSRVRRADLKRQRSMTSFYANPQASPKQGIKENKARRNQPTREGTKGAMIPPTRENMEQVPSPTFLKGRRK